MSATADDLELESLLHLTALADASRHKSATKEELGQTGSEGELAHKEIELRAYRIFLDRGGAHGHDVEDWMRAQQELLEKAGAERRRDES